MRLLVQTPQADTVERATGPMPEVTATSNINDLLKALKPREGCAAVTRAPPRQTVLREKLTLLRRSRPRAGRGPSAPPPLPPTPIHLS